MLHDKPECYGKMFPDLLRLRVNEPCAGSVFSVGLKSAGIGVQSREVRVDEEKWRECEACPHYRQCYDLSAGTFMVRLAVWQK